MDVFNADRTRALDGDAGNKAVDPHGQVFARQHWMEITRGGTLAPAVPDSHLHPCEAILLNAVVIVIERVAHILRTCEVGFDQWILITRLTGGQRAVTAAIVAGPAFPTLLFTEIGQHLLVGPVRQPT